jgi:hypothetical protein
MELLGLIEGFVKTAGRPAATETETDALWEALNCSTNSVYFIAPQDSLPCALDLTRITWTQSKFSKPISLESILILSLMNGINQTVDRDNGWWSMKMRGSGRREIVLGNAVGASYVLNEMNWQDLRVATVKFLCEGGENIKKFNVLFNVLVTWRRVTGCHNCHALLHGSVFILHQPNAAI